MGVRKPILGVLSPRRPKASIVGRSSQADLRMVAEAHHPSPPITGPEIRAGRKEGWLSAVFRPQEVPEFVVSIGVLWAAGPASFRIPIRIV